MRFFAVLPLTLALPLRFFTKYPVIGEHKRYAVFSLSIVMQYITPGYASTGYVATEASYYLAPTVVF